MHSALRLARLTSPLALQGSPKVFYVVGYCARVEMAVLALLGCVLIVWSPSFVVGRVLRRRYALTGAALTVIVFEGAGISTFRVMPWKLRCLSIDGRWLRVGSLIHEAVPLSMACG